MGEKKKTALTRVTVEPGVSAVVCTPQPPRHALCRLRVASFVKALLAACTRQLARRPSTLGPFEGSSPPAPAPATAASGLHLDARHGRGTPRTRVARALSGNMLREGSHAPCRRRRPFGIDAARQRVSCVRVGRGLRHGAAGQAPLAVSRARVPCSLDGLCCWCQVVCIPGCDRPLSKDEAEPSPWQPTAELVDGALNSADAAVGPRGYRSKLWVR